MPAGSSQGSNPVTGDPELPRILFGDEQRKFAKRVIVPSENENQARRTEMDIGTILVIVLVLALVGAIPTWGYSRNWGYGPSGGIGAVVLIILILILLGYI